MGNSYSNMFTSMIMEASVSSGCKNGGFVEPSESLMEYREGNLKSEQIVKVKSLKVMKKRLPGRRSRLYHEFVLIELHEFADQALGMIILAEKNYTCESRRLGGVIKVFIPDTRTLHGPEYEVKCRIDLSECGGIFIKDLLNDLERHNARYSVGMNNCWKYAYDASCKVLERCEEHPDTSRETKEAIEHFLETTLVRPELLGECVTLSKILRVGIGCALVASLLLLCWYKIPLGVFARISAVKGLGIGMRTSKNFVRMKAIRNCISFVCVAACGGIAVYGCVECGSYIWRVVS